MYVNEVGYNKSLNQNVFICDDEDRVVKYFFKNSTSMKSGDTVELLTNYGAMYEAVRERKGYGWSNMNGNAIGDDVFAHSLRRNFQMRVEVENSIKSDLCLQELKEFLDFVNINTWIPLVDLYTNQANNGEMSDALTATQMKAILRIQWIMHRIQQKLESFQEPASKNNLLEKIIVYNARKTLASMQLRSNQLSLAQHIKSSKKSLISKALSDEMIEVVCFDVNEYLPMLFDRSIYCVISCKLITKLCEIIADKCSFGETNKTGSGMLKLNREVFEEFIKVATVAVDAIKDSIVSFREGGDGAGLRFTNTSSRKCCFTGTIEQGFKYATQSTGFFLQHSIISKAVLAALVEKIAYFECLVLGGVEPQWDTYAQPLELPDTVVMVEFTGISSMDVDTDLRSIGSSPRSVTSARQIGASINTTWYVLWQVFWPVHVFATTFLDNSVYSMERLCQEVQLPLSTARYAIANGIGKSNDMIDYTFIPCCTPKHYHASTLTKKNTSSKTQKSDQPFAHRKHVYNKPTTKKDQSVPNIKVAARCIYEGPVQSFPAHIPSEGWIQKTFERQSGASKGSTDSYWFSPQSKYRLRSHREIERFVEALKKFSGDEGAAFKYK
jgi:hypothetical protein